MCFGGKTAQLPVEEAAPILSFFLKENDLLMWHYEFSIKV